MLRLILSRGEAQRVCCAVIDTAASDSTLCCMTSAGTVREERVENGGPLGKEDVNNKDIETVETELSNARQQGTADPFALYLYGLVLIDRWVLCYLCLCTFPRLLAGFCSSADRAV